MHRTGTTAQRRQTTARPRSSRLALALGLLALVTAACRDASSPGVTAPNFLISDATHNAGKPHFYFLPPVVAAPEVSGVFDPALTPAVEICSVAGAGCDVVIATFSTTSGPGSETVRLDGTAEQYVVNWQTGQFALDPARTYRIRVLVGDLELGFADVDVVSSGRELRNVNTGEYIPLVDGRTLPIKFRIERGFLARIEVVPGVGTVAPAGTQQFMAVLTDLHGDVLSGPPVAWASSNGAVATVDQTGLATAVGAGVVTITATAARVTGSAQLTVVVPVVAFTTVIGSSTKFIPRADQCGQPAGRLCESLEGDVVTDAMRAQYAAIGVEFAIMNSGGLRADLTCPTIDNPTDFCPPYTPPPFPITRGQVRNVMPFGNSVVTVTVNGAELKTMLENGVSQMPVAAGRFPQVSGLCFTYDVAAPAGSRVISALRTDASGNCTATPVDLTSASSYKIAENDFTARGGDGYPDLSGRYTPQDIVDQVVADYIAANSPLSPFVRAFPDGRINCVDSNGATGPNCPTVTVSP
jgi:hypothetical protein